MQRTSTYGRNIEEPVKLNSIPASIIFLNNLVSVNGYHIIYHRIGSKRSQDDRITDHYEIMTTDNIYDDIFIDVYNDRSEWVPPEGYFFEKMPDMMCYELMNRENLEKLDEEDEIAFSDEYLLPMMDADLNFEDLIENNRKLPALEKVIFDSLGTNSFTADFPVSLLREYFAELQFSPEETEKMISSVRARIQE